MSKTQKTIPIGTKIKFNIAQGMDTGEGIIKSSRIEPEYSEETVFYEIEVTKGSKADMHRNEDGALWVIDCEVKL